MTSLFRMILKINRRLRAPIFARFCSNMLSLIGLLIMRLSYWKMILRTPGAIHRHNPKLPLCWQNFTVPMANTQRVYPLSE